MHQYLKSYFRQHKKHGSKDRKLISGLCYNYFRLGQALKNTAVEERMLLGYFLCEHRPSEFLESIKPLWNNEITRPLQEKLQIANWTATLFPFEQSLSDHIDYEKFSYSFLNQPKLFVRIRPGFKNAVLQKLVSRDITHEVIAENCIALPNSSQINAILETDKEAVVQDLNSQKIGEPMKLAIGPKSGQDVLRVWDCCAASGGKSILAYDINPSIQLTVSDKRIAILKNLEKRFKIAGIKNYSPMVADLSTSPMVFSTPSGQRIDTPPDKNYDFIIADVPCTGSGTWARTPEQLYYFDRKHLKKYCVLQKQIIENAIPFLKPGGYLLYVTCSVFKQENEEAVGRIQSILSMNLVEMQLLKGYDKHADTMFCALFTRPR